MKHLVKAEEHFRWEKFDTLDIRYGLVAACFDWHWAAYDENVVHEIWCHWTRPRELGAHFHIPRLE
jgi:hypothetical protein